MEEINGIMVGYVFLFIGSCCGLIPFIYLYMKSKDDWHADGFAGILAFLIGSIGSIVLSTILIFIFFGVYKLFIYISKII